MAYTYAYTGVGSPSTVLRSDGSEFPQDPGNVIYQEWLAFTAGGGSTTAAPTVTLAARKLAAQAYLRDRAADLRLTALGSRQADSVFQALRFREAQDCEADGSPTEGEYPLLAAEIGSNGANLDEVHDNVLAELATLKTDLVAIEEVRIGAHDDVEGAADAVDIDAILAAVVWP